MLIVDYVLGTLPQRLMKQNNQSEKLFITIKLPKVLSSMNHKVIRIYRNEMVSSPSIPESRLKSNMNKASLY